MIDVEDWAEIRRLHRAEQMSIRAIAARLGIARNTVRAALRSPTAPKYERARGGSAVDAVDGEIRELLREFPSMPATVIAERIGWRHGMTILKERVRELRPLFAPPDPAQRTSYRPGERAQWDLWQPDVEIPVGFGQSFKGWVVNGVSAFSRFHAGWMVPTRSAHDVLGGMLRVLGQFGALPRLLVWDQEGCIGQWRQGRQRLSDEFQAFRGTVIPCGGIIASASRRNRERTARARFTTGVGGIRGGFDEPGDMERPAFLPKPAGQFRAPVSRPTSDTVTTSAAPKRRPDCAGNPPRVEPTR